MAKSFAFALLGLLALTLVTDVVSVAVSDPIPPGTNCNKSCYRRAGLKPTKLALFTLCKVSGVKILSEVAPRIADMRTMCLTYIYHRFPSPKAMFKYQNCEANQPLYQKTMRAIKGTGNFWGTNGKPPKFSAC